MERVTLRIPKQQIEEVERMVETGEFPNRSEAIRSAVRDMLNEQTTDKRSANHQQARLGKGVTMQDIVREAMERDEAERQTQSSRRQRRLR